MDVWKELVGLSIDCVFFALSYAQYSFFTKTLQAIKKAEELGINPEIEGTNNKEEGSVIIKGNVVPLTGDLVYSFHSPQGKGVVQKITVTEHNISKNATGFWSDSKNVLQEITNTVPFGIKNGNYVVEVSDLRETYILDLDTVAAKFEPTKLSMMDFLLGFFSGVRQRGIETTEEMLKEGTLLTGIGQLTVVNNMKTLGPPSDGSAYILTVAPMPSLIRKIKDEQTTMRWLLYLFGTIGVVLIGIIAKRGYKFYAYKMNEREVKRRLEESRRERRIANRSENEELPENQCCVVCRNHPREIILLPCGHLCLCEECNALIHDKCPVCRCTIASKSPVFF